MVAAFAALAHAGIWAGDSFVVALAGVWAETYAPALASGGLRAAFLAPHGPLKLQDAALAAAGYRRGLGRYIATNMTWL